VKNQKGFTTVELLMVTSIIVVIVIALIFGAILLTAKAVHAGQCDYIVYIEGYVLYYESPVDQTRIYVEKIKASSVESAGNKHIRTGIGPWLIIYPCEDTDKIGKMLYIPSSDVLNIQYRGMSETELIREYGG